jgi:hypothetical protein
MILCSIWHDEEFVALPAGVQRVYFLLLSQPGLTLAGKLDYSPKRWGRRAPDTSTADIEDAVATLEQAGFVIVDHDTEELLIRTFVRHDLGPHRLSAPTVKGFWNAWRLIESAHIRAQVLEALPADTWGKLKPLAPPEAMEKPRSFPFEPEEADPFERVVLSPFEREALSPFEREEASPFEREEPFPSERDEPSPFEPEAVDPFEWEVPFPLEPPSPSPSPSPSPPHAHAQTRETPATVGAGGEKRRRKTGAPRLRVAEEACDLLADAQHDAAATAGKVRNPDAHRAACRRGARADHLDRAQLVAFDHRDWSARQIADELLAEDERTEPRPGEPQPARLYAAADEVRRQRAAEAPPADPALCLSGVAEARAALAAIEAEEPHG